MFKHKCACTNKSRGSEMHWVGGGGGLSPRRANTLHVRIEHICVKVVVFFRVLSCIAKKANDMYACFGVKTVIVTNKVSLN